ncbi:hypothetical protein M3Y99_00071500 [Aphelenchoides fujianensis]|nr:hypothetical protein M3Y99_00071500 [Aphelenchoides fujianensis]
MPLSSSLLSLICVLLLVALESTSSSVCNENTPFECKCSRCYRHFVSQNDSIVVEFEKCADAKELDLLRFRTRVAFWLKEDCGFILRCPHFFAKDLSERNIVITEFLCAPESIPSRVGLLGLWNASGNSETMDSRVELDVMQSVLANREHLLSHELRSPLLRIGRGSELVRKRSVEFTWQQLVQYGAVSAAITFACSSTLVSMRGAEDRDKEEIRFH